MKLKNLRNFNPDMVAKTETCMWQAYYRHHFLKLFILLLQLAHEQFQLSYFYALLISYPPASAAIYFRKNRGTEDKSIILKKLIKFYKNINNIAIDKFDYQKAAELELEWWLVDRYPERYQTSRRNALRDSIASIYNANPQNLTEYAEYRAQAMELQDQAEKENGETDWDKVQSLLLISYRSLYKSIN